MRKRMLVISLLGLSCLFAATALGEPPNVASMDWSVKAPHNLAADPPSDDAMVAFMAKLQGIPPNFVICSSKFADLRHASNLSLIVSAADGRFCDLNIVDKTSSGFEMSNLQLAHYDNDVKLEDLGGDGKLELIVPTDLTGYDGAQHCIAEWPVIYGWTRGDYRDVSGLYKHYYEEELAALRKESASDDCTKAEIAKIERFIGISPNAGMSDAIKWANSKNPHDSEFAVWIFADIATPAAIKYLRGMSRDSDSEKASSAKNALELIRKGPVTYTAVR
jgi:hypothetical protein